MLQDAPMRQDANVAKPQHPSKTDTIRKDREVVTTDMIYRVDVSRNGSMTVTQIVLTLVVRGELYVVRRRGVDQGGGSPARLIGEVASRNLFMSASQVNCLVEHRSELVESSVVEQADWLEQHDLNGAVSTVVQVESRTLRFKRMVDVAGAAVMLVLLTPIMGLVALAVRLTSPGPVLFRQVRTGLNLRQQKDRRAASSAAHANERRDRRPDRRLSEAYGRPFVLYKFRTMRTDAEKDGAKFAVKGDPRVTRIGRFLRKSRLDELPQLWNVLRGEMSLVGPRPERPEFIEQLSEQIPNYLVRLGIKPGLTGLAQIVNGYDNELEGFRRKVTLDLHYLRNCSIKNDLRILFRTVGVVLTGKGAL